MKEKAYEKKRLLSFNFARIEFKRFRTIRLSIHSFLYCFFVLMRVGLGF
mgnify:CR=1 FL=1